MSVAGSGLYLGHVTHARRHPRVHALRYGVFQMLLDLDEGAALSRRLVLFGFERPGLVSFRARDHGERDGSSLRGFVNRVLADAGQTPCEGRLLIQCMPRILGFVFNPLTLYYCHDRAGALRAIVLQVHNTFGQRHAYVAPVAQDGAAAIKTGCPKSFHVSPFMGMDFDYRFDLGVPGETVRTVVRALDREGRLVLHADFTGERRELTDRALAGALLRRPLLTLKVVAAIHFEAVKLLLKGVRLAPQPPAPASDVTVSALLPSA